MALYSQQRIRSVYELVNRHEPFWPHIIEWKLAAKNKVEVLPKIPANADSALYQTQVTTRSPMGAIIYECAGILIDDGWIRILGSGDSKLNRSMPAWNKGKSITNYGDAAGFYLVADDVLGGFFAVNGGGFGEETRGKVYYFDPSSLEWENLDVTYSDFINFCFNGDLELFYKGLRWTNWRNDVRTLDPDKGFTFFPFLFTKEGKDIDKASKAPVPIQELWDFHLGNK